MKKNFQVTIMTMVVWALMVLVGGSLAQAQSATPREETWVTNGTVHAIARTPGYRIHRRWFQVCRTEHGARRADRHHKRPRRGDVSRGEWRGPGQCLRWSGRLVHRRRSRTRTTNSFHRFRIWPNRVKGLAVTRPDQVWVSDITYIRRRGGFAYLFLVTDVYSRKIVGWTLGETLETRWSLDALGHGHQGGWRAVGGANSSLRSRGSVLQRRLC